MSSIFRIMGFSFMKNYRRIKILHEIYSNEHFGRHKSLLYTRSLCNDESMISCHVVADEYAILN